MSDKKEEEKNWFKKQWNKIFKDKEKAKEEEANEQAMFHKNMGQEAVLHKMCKLENLLSLSDNSVGLRVQPRRTDANCPAQNETHVPIFEKIYGKDGTQW